VQVRVRLFAGLREHLGTSALTLELGEGATAEDCWNALAARDPGLSKRRQSLALAVNRTYAPFSQRLAPDDEVAFIPPVSGG
jgi:molybdopterin converting factor subunit 1